jgi:hypothetical protein
MAISPFLQCRHVTPKRAQVLFRFNDDAVLVLVGKLCTRRSARDEAAPIMPDIGFPLGPAPDRTLNLP